MLGPDAPNLAETSHVKEYSKIVRQGGPLTILQAPGAIRGPRGSKTLAQTSLWGRMGSSTLWPFATGLLGALLHE